MIDFHTHILPDIDDGAKSAETSERMIASACAQGIDRIALTPHYYGKERSVEQFIEDRARAYQSILPFIPDRLRVKLGAEVYLDSVVAEDQLVKLRIEGTTVILVELPYRGDWSPRIYERLDKLVRLGLTPLVAHIERYDTVRKTPAAVEKLIEIGCVIQANADTFCEKNRLCETLLKHGQIQIVASDAHDPETRPMRLQEAYERIERRFGTETVKCLNENADALWNNYAVEVSGFTPVKKIFGFIG